MSSQDSLLTRPLVRQVAHFISVLQNPDHKRELVGRREIGPGMAASLLTGASAASGLPADDALPDGLREEGLSSANQSWGLGIRTSGENKAHYPIDPAADLPGEA